jgi:hypothetical protein
MFNYEEEHKKVHEAIHGKPVEPGTPKKAELGKRFKPLAAQEPITLLCANCTQPIDVHRQYCICGYPTKATMERIRAWQKSRRV